MKPEKYLFGWIDQQQLSIQVMIEKIKNNIPFQLARFGDGEFDSMVVDPRIRKGANCDGHEYFPEMGVALKNSIREWREKTHPHFYAGIHFSKRNGRETIDWLNKERFDYSRKFTNNSVFHNAFVDKSMEQLMDAFEGKKVVLVAHRLIHDQNRVKTFANITVPRKNSWKKRMEVMLELQKLELGEGDIILFCSGPPTPVFITDQLAYSGKHATMIDFGVSFDPYMGIDSRSFHRKHEVPFSDAKNRSAND